MALKIVSAEFKPLIVCDTVYWNNIMMYVKWYWVYAELLVYSVGV